MKKTLFLTIIAAALTLGGCQSDTGQPSGKENAETPEAAIAPTTEQLQTENTGYRKTMAQIARGFKQIYEAEGIITNAEAEGSDQQTIIESITFIQRKLKDNRKRIAELEQQLRNSKQKGAEAVKDYKDMVDAFSLQLESMNAKIDTLKKQLANKDIIIAELDETIDKLNDDVSDLTTQNEEQERTMADQDKKLHTAWYVYGTKKELREQKILEKSDVLKSSDFNKNYFREIDTRKTTSITFQAGKAELKTSHPSDSYTLTKGNDDLYTLNISNPEKFWSVSKYLVIIVK